MKRWFVIFLLLLMIVSQNACGGKEEKNSRSDRGVQQEEEVVSLEILLSKKYIDEWDEKQIKMCSASWQEVMLSREDAEDYPELAKRLEEVSEEFEKLYSELLNDLFHEAHNAAVFDGEFFSPFYSKSSLAIQRADNLILSIREDFGTYSGGLHGMYGALGMNYDPITGEDLLITDVLTDITALPAVLAKKIKENYTDEDETYESLEEYLKNEYEPKDYHWTMSYQGITFYFLPYEIASYAEGMLRVTLWFDEIDDLIKEKYTQMPEGGYIMVMPFGEDVDIDLNASDKNRDQIAVSSFYQTKEEQENGIWHIKIRRNDSYYETLKGYGYEFTPYLVCVKEQGREKYFIYVEAISENDYRTLYLYDLNKEEISLQKVVEGTGFLGYWDEEAGEHGSYYDKVPLDPQSFELGTRMHILGTLTGRRSYSANPETGIPETQMNHYLIDDSKNPLVSRLPLKVLILSGDGNEELPAGTRFYFLRTDGENYVDMRLEDGRECRMDVEYVDWEYRINGISEWDCFQELFYAG